MIRSSFVCLLLSCVICSFCGKDFVTLGRHQWRCKEKIDDPNLFVNSNNPTADGISVDLSLVRQLHLLLKRQELNAVAVRFVKALEV